MVPSEDIIKRAGMGRVEDSRKGGFYATLILFLGEESQ
jgi:hypothetical protein